jgi:hypothetical protein
MPTAPHTADLATQPRPGAGTRLLRHLGGAVCSAIAGSATPFTPEAFPGLDPAFCKFLNTPLEKCDPEMLRLLLAALAPLIAAALPPGSGMADAKDVFATPCDRLGTDPGEASPDAPPACAPHPEPVPPADPLPNAASEQPPEAQAAPAADEPVAAASPAAPDAQAVPPPAAAPRRSKPKLRPARRAAACSAAAPALRRARQPFLNHRAPHPARDARTRKQRDHRSTVLLS